MKKHKYKIVLIIFGLIFTWGLYLAFYKSKKTESDVTSGIRAIKIKDKKEAKALEKQRDIALKKTVVAEAKVDTLRKIVKILVVKAQKSDTKADSILKSIPDDKKIVSDIDNPTTVSSFIAEDYKRKAYYLPNGDSIY